MKDIIQSETNPIITYLVMCIKRIYVSTLGINRLLREYKVQQELEYSIGLLIRPVLLDILSIEYFVHLHRQEEKFEKDFEEKIDTFCKGFLFDGTNKWVEQFELDFERGLISPKVLEQYFNSFSEKFPLLFHGPKIKNHGFKNPYKVESAKKLYKKLKSIDNTQAKVWSKIYYLYNYYSKFEHLSYWTMMILDAKSNKKDIQLEEVTVRMLKHMVNIYVYLKDCNPIFYDEAKIVANKLNDHLKP